MPHSNLRICMYPQHILHKRYCCSNTYLTYIHMQMCWSNPLHHLYWCLRAMPYMRFVTKHLRLQHSTQNLRANMLCSCGMCWTGMCPIHMLCNCHRLRTRTWTPRHTHRFRTDLPWYYWYSKLHFPNRHHNCCCLHMSRYSWSRPPPMWWFHPGMRYMHWPPPPNKNPTHMNHNLTSHHSLQCVRS